MIALEDLRTIRHLLAWNGIMGVSSIQTWKSTQHGIREYIKTFNILALDALMPRLVSMYTKQNSKTHVISVEDNQHERIACEVLSLKQFTEKIKTVFRTEGTLYYDFKKSCMNEGG